MPDIFGGLRLRAHHADTAGETPEVGLNRSDTDIWENHLHGEEHSGFEAILMRSLPPQASTRSERENLVASPSSARAGAEPTTGQTMHDAPGSTPLHQAVMRNDTEMVQQLIAEGQRPNQLDETGRSPLDLLDQRQALSPSVKAAMKASLLKSSNPTAPEGHLKWEAGHGTPWGLEVIKDGTLRGGINDPKGGSESLEGQVFFSDRTPRHEADDVTRDDLRSKARLYAQGKGTKPSNATNRAKQHRYTQAIEQAVGQGKPLQVTGASKEIHVSSTMGRDAAVKKLLQKTFTLAGFSHRDISAKPLGELSAVKLPKELKVCDAETGQVHSISGQDLEALYKGNVQSLGEDLEADKAPFLAMINKGNVVPVVFGFEKIEGLKSHRISGATPESYSQFSYKERDHPLRGDESGGRLREVEVPSRDDLATLHLGMLAKNTALPSSVTFRINPRPVEKKNGARATYLSAEEAETFRNQVTQRLGAELGVPPPDVPRALSSLPMERLQELNQVVRSNARDETS